MCIRKALIRKCHVLDYIIALTGIHVLVAPGPTARRAGGGGGPGLTGAVHLSVVRAVERGRGGGGEADYCYCGFCVLFSMIITIIITVVEMVRSIVGFVFISFK